MNHGASPGGRAPLDSPGGDNEASLRGGGETHEEGVQRQQEEVVSSSLTSSSSGGEQMGMTVAAALEATGAPTAPLQSPPSWVEWFCQLKDNGMFCEIDRAFLEDNFNSAGLEDVVPFFSRAMDIVLDLDDTAVMEAMDDNTRDAIESAAEMLYGLLHQRFILSQRGMKRMFRKYQKCEFGRCHRVHCHGQRMLPVGQSDLPNQTSVNLFCPRCKDIYFPPDGKGNIDGAYFGTTFPHVFLMRYPAAIPKPPRTSYEPRVYGFRVHKSSPIYAHVDAPVPTAVSDASRDETKEKGRGAVIMPRGTI